MNERDDDFELKSFAFDAWQAARAKPVVNADADSIAMQTAKEVMHLMHGPMPIGGSVQLMAQVQCLVHEAIGRFAKPVVQEGWKLVPLEPTNEMAEVGVEARWRSCVRDANCVRTIYKAMLAAAPKGDV